MSDVLIEGSDAILQSLDADDLLANGLPFSRCTDAVQQSIDEASMTADFVIVTRSKSINRNGHMVQIAPDDSGRGLVLDNFERNPIVLWNHGQDAGVFPIARSSVPKLSKSKATATATFSQSNPDAMAIFALIAEGILNTASVSFLPMRARLAKQRPEKLGDDEVSFRGPMVFDFIDNDLLEWSIVDVPADPGAVRRHLERGGINECRFSRALSMSLSRVAEPRVVQGTGVSLPCSDLDPAGVEDTVEQQASVGADGSEADQPAEPQRQSVVLPTAEQVRQRLIRDAVADAVERECSAMGRRLQALEDDIRRATGRVSAE